METAPNDAAFPEGKDDVPGLTKREWFAGMALQGIIACPQSHGDSQEMAVWVLEYADALIAALNKEDKP